MKKRTKIIIGILVAPIALIALIFLTAVIMGIILAAGISEGAKTYHTNDYVADESHESFDGKHSISGTEVTLSIIPSNEYEEGGVIKQEGPYQLRLDFERDLDEVIIHDITIESNLGNSFELSQTFPMTLEPIIRQEVNLYYYRFPDELDFLYKEDEIIFVELEAEIKRNGFSKRGTESFKQIPQFFDTTISRGFGV